MQKERHPSLFLPKFTAFLLIIVFLSGMSEIIIFSTYAIKTSRSLTSQKTKLTKKPGDYTIADEDGTTGLVSQESDN